MIRQTATSPTEAVQARHEVAQRVILPPNLPEALKNLHDDQLQLRIPAMPPRHTDLIPPGVPG